MQPRDSSTDDLWSIVSLDDFSDDLLAIAGVNDDDDMTSTAAGCSDERRDALLPQQSMTTTAAATAKVKSAKTKATRSVVRRNERERNRVKQVNQGFDRLRQYVRLPGLSKKKLSKVDTLRAAVVYIKQLQSLLDDFNAAASLHGNEQLPSSLQQPQYQQQQQPDAVASPSSDFVFLSLLQTGITSPTESYEATANTFGILPTSSTPLCTTYSTGSAWLPLADINDNNYVVAESSSQCPEPCPPWSPDADDANTQNVSEQRRRLSELTAWLME